MATEYQVVGPPGTGKTRWLSDQVAKWSVNHLSRDFVLTSFTRAAAAVLAGRIPVPKENVATLHALGYRALGGKEAHPFAEHGAIAQAWNAKVPPAWQVGADNQVDDELVLADTYSGLSVFEEYNLLRAKLDPQDPRWLRTDIQSFAAAWTAHKQANGDAVDYMDMLERALRETDCAPGEPLILIVDEAQDLLPVQWALVRKWARHPAVTEYVVAGDPAQTLYSWIGSSPSELMHPLPEERRRMLRQSHRLPLAVHQRAEAWLARHSGPMLAGRVYSPRLDESKQVVPGVVREVPFSLYDDDLLDAVEERVHAGKECMILASCAYMLQPLLTAMRERGLLFHNPYRYRQGAWNPLGAPRAGTVRTLDRALAFLRPDAGTWDGAHRDWLPEEVLLWSELLSQKAFLVRNGKAALKVRMEHVRAHGGRVAVEDLADLLAPETFYAAAASDLSWLVQHGEVKEERLLPYLAAVQRRQGGMALRAAPRVVVGTIHSTKGAESDVVFLAPDVSKAASEESEEHGPDALIRMGYVGMTRAREELVLLAPGKASELSRRYLEW